MILDIKPLHDQRRDCIEDVIASLAHWLKRDYELMFLNEWYFIFDSISNNNKLLCDRINIEQTDKYLLLEKYHGIGLSCRQASSFSEIISSARKSISDGLPVILATPSYWCPWSPSYKKHNDGINHTFLVIGIDSKRDILYCTDPYCMVYNAPFPLKEANLNYLILGNFKISDKTEECNWIEEIKKTAFKIKKTTDSFKSIRDFGMMLSSISDLTSEMGNQLSLWRKIHELQKNRSRFSIILEYLGKRYCNQRLLLLANNILQVASKWESINNLLLKTYNKIEIQKDYDYTEMLKKTPSKIMEIADNEENVANNILKLCEEDNEIFEEDIEILNTSEHDNENIITIELSSYYNNNGFGSSSYPGSLVNIDNSIRYFLDNDLPKEQLWNIQKMKFIFPKIAKGRNDNISCQGQIIKIPHVFYSKVMFLGCATLGSQMEKLVIEYTDGYSEEIPFEFTDCWNPQPAFGEIIAWKGKYKIDNSAAVAPPEWVHLYAQCYPINKNRKVKCLKLPDCPEIHIFAISFC